MSKFPVFGTIKNSFQFIFENWRHALKIALPLAIFLIGLSISSLILDALETKEEFQFILGGLQIFYLVIQSIVLAVPALLWQRLYLHNNSPEHEFGALRPKDGRYICAYAILLFFFTSLVTIVTLVLYSYISFFNLHPVLYINPLYTSLPVIYISFLFMLAIVSVLLLSYVTMISSNAHIALKKFLRLFSKNILRLTFISLIICYLYTVSHALLTVLTTIWNFDESFIAIKESLAQISPTDSTITFLTLFSPSLIVEMIFLKPAAAALGVIAVMIGITNIAQYQKWAIAQQKPQETA